MTTIPDTVYAAADIAWNGACDGRILRACTEAVIAEYERLNGALATHYPELERRIADLTADLAASKKAYLDVADALARESTGPEHLCRIARQLRADLATEQKERDRVTADLAAAQKRIGELEAEVKSPRVLHVKAQLDKAESALTRARFVRCDGEAGWKPPIGKKPLSLSIRRFRASRQTDSFIPDANGVWVGYRDIMAWERGEPIAPPYREPGGPEITAEQCRQLADEANGTDTGKPEPAPTLSPREAALNALSNDHSAACGDELAELIADAIAAAIDASWKDIDA